MANDWIAQLHQAAIQADGEWLQHLVEQIPKDQDALVMPLMALIETV